MNSPTFSYAHALRVVGQALDTLGIDSFRLEKKGEKYIVRNWEPSFLRTVAESVWGRRDSNTMHMLAGDHSAVLIYTSADTNRLENQGRSRRGSKPMIGNKVSSALRSVGDYLDRRRAAAFEISWSRDSVRVKYTIDGEGQREANFTLQDLHDVGIGMYLRRASRRVAK